MSHLSLKLFAASLAVAASIVPSAAEARHHDRGYDQNYARDGYAPGDYYAQGSYDQRGYDQRGYDRGYDQRSSYYAQSGYDGGYGYAPVQSNYYDAPYQRGQVRGRCGKGTGGTILGAIAGGLLGNAVAGRGDRGTGAIIGAGVGALTGRAIDRNC